MSVWLEGATRNQHLFREVNERLREIADPEADRTDYICECGALDCTERVELDEREYDAVRSMPDVFLVVPGHHRLEVERVIVERERFIVVETILRFDPHDPGLPGSPERWWPNAP